MFFFIEFRYYCCLKYLRSLKEENFVSRNFYGVKIILKIGVVIKFVEGLFFLKIILGSIFSGIMFMLYILF